MKCFASAPSNIALIKYMGKSDVDRNLPANSSLSYTLDNLRSYVELDVIEEDKDRWDVLKHPECEDFNLPMAGQERYLQHLSMIKKIFGVSESFLVRSNNNFPSHCGLASSASSFAALTSAAIEAMHALANTKPILSFNEIAMISRQGSGSSCRSFYSPWALWTHDEVKAIELPYTQLLHHVIVIESSAKSVSSSEAHQRIIHSPLYQGRMQRAEDNLQQLLRAFRDENWQQSYEIVWREFMDMHELFHTAQPEFSYISPKARSMLKLLHAFWQENGDGPLITMDAGPNIHLLFCPEQAVMRDELAAYYSEQIAWNG